MFSALIKIRFLGLFENRSTSETIIETRRILKLVIIYSKQRGQRTQYCWYQADTIREHYSFDNIQIW